VDERPNRLLAGGMGGSRDPRTRLHASRGAGPHPSERGRGIHHL